MTDKELWEAICDVTRDAFSCTARKDAPSVGLEGHFSADDLRKIAAVLDRAVE